MILNKTAFPLVLFFLLSLNYSFSQNTEEGPFELNPGKEAVIIGAGTAIGITALFVISNNDKLTEDGISSLNPESISGFDRIAIGPYQQDVLGDALVYILWFE